MPPEEAAVKDPFQRSSRGFGTLVMVILVVVLGYVLYLILGGNSGINNLLVNVQSGRGFHLTDITGPMDQLGRAIGDAIGGLFR
jgi:hypothetical protein